MMFVLMYADVKPIQDYWWHTDDQLSGLEW